MNSFISAVTSNFKKIYGSTVKVINVTSGNIDYSTGAVNNTVKYKNVEAVVSPVTTKRNSEGITISQQNTFDVLIHKKDLKGFIVGLSSMLEYNGNQYTINEIKDLPDDRVIHIIMTRISGGRNVST